MPAVEANGLFHTVIFESTEAWQRSNCCHYPLFPPKIDSSLFLGENTGFFTPLVKVHQPNNLSALCATSQAVQLQYIRHQGESVKKRNGVLRSQIPSKMTSNVEQPWATRYKLHHGDNSLWSRLSSHSGRCVNMNSCLALYTLRLTQTARHRTVSAAEKIGWLRCVVLETLKHSSSKSDIIMKYVLKEKQF